MASQKLKQIKEENLMFLLIQYQVMLKENMLRNLPSIKPMKSQSPDSKRNNIINPTKSPQKGITMKLAHNNLQELFYYRKYTNYNTQDQNGINSNLKNLAALHNKSVVSQGKPTLYLDTNQSDSKNDSPNEVNHVSSRVHQQGTFSPQAFNISFRYEGQMNKINQSPYLTAQVNINDSVLHKYPKNLIPQTHNIRTMKTQSNYKSNQFRQYNGKSEIRNQDCSASSFKQYNQKNIGNMNFNNLNTSIQQGVSSFRYFEQTIRQKDQLISELRNILAIISQSQSKQSSGKVDMSERKQQQQVKRQMQQQIHVLTIQNQKLLAIIDKLSSRQNDPNKSIFNRGSADANKQDKQQQLEQLKKQIQQLQQSIISNRLSHEKEMDSLLESHKFLANHCNDIEKNFKNVQQQNKRLLKLLQQKDSSQRRLFQQKRVSQFSVEPDNLTDKGDKLTIAKIKEQYNENMKLFKQNVYDQVDQMYNTIQQTIEQTNDRLIISQARVKQLQQRLQSLGKTVVIVNRQKRLKKNKKSQIYIQEAPQSSSDREEEAYGKIVRSDQEQDQQQQSQSTKRQDLGTKLSSIVQQSRVRQVEQLKEQLERVTYELNQLRFKYDKMSLDSETTPYSMRDLGQDSICFLKQNEVKQNNTYLQLVDLKQKFEELSTLHQTLKNVVSGSEAQSKVQAIIAYEQRISQLQKKVAQYQEQLISFNNDLEYKDQQIQKLVKDLGNKNILIQKLVSDIDIKDNQKQKLSNVIEKAVNDLNIKDKLMENQREETQHKAKLVAESFQQQICILKQQISNKDIRQRQLRQEISQLIIIKDQLTQANQTLSQADAKNLQLGNDLKMANQKLNKIKSENTVEQLKQVKRLINPEQLLKLELQFTELSDLYDKTLFQYQEKVKENQIINQENAVLTEKVLKNQENNIMLRERISLLETTISVYQSQLKNRKQLYENLMQRKSATQIEGQKLKRQRDQANKQKFNEIKENSRIVNEKIDFILGMQTLRQKQLQQLIKTIGTVSNKQNKIAQSTERFIERQKQSYQVENFSQK